MATTEETPVDVLDAANFAVNQQKEYPSLKFVRVVLNVKYMKIYFMILKCTDGKSTGYYVAIVSDIFIKYLVIFKRVFGWTDVNYIESSTETQINQMRVLAVDAVAEYNKEQKRSIEFRRVVAAQQLDGGDYRLIIMCEDGDYIKFYEVIEKRLEEFESLNLYNKQQVSDALQGTDDAEEWDKMQPEMTFGVLA